MLWPQPKKTAPGGLAIDIAPPVGTAVRLMREELAGRVVARVAGGLVCRIRLYGWAGTTIERPCCDLLPYEKGDSPSDMQGKRV